MAFWVGRCVAAIRLTRDRSAQAGDGVGVPGSVGRVVGQLGVFIR